MAFLEDPRLRQRWNQITHDAEAVTENAAAGIWTFQHSYINPCLSSITATFEQCTTVCLGDAEERLRRKRERERARGEAEYSFDFYDDWYEEEHGGGLLGSWGNEDWDRLLAGTGNHRKHTGAETTEQPRRKRGMSYGTRGGRRRLSEHDPTVIPSTQPIGFLGRLPWKMGGTLRYKPSAADLQDHPQRHGGEAEPLLASHHDDDAAGYGDMRAPRQRSGTTGSGDTSDSYRSRGDLFPSDGEGEEDAVALDDDVTYDMVRMDDRSSGKSGKTRDSTGKRPAHPLGGSRTVSRTTLGSVRSRESLQAALRSASLSATPDVGSVPSLEDLKMEEHLLQQAEEEELVRKKEAALQLAAERGLAPASANPEPIPEPKPPVMTEEEDTGDEEQDDDEFDGLEQPLAQKGLGLSSARPTRVQDKDARPRDVTTPEPPNFVPARLPHFG